ncbi:hypothetical protein PRIC1_010822 [Phytophthora ramorum]
MTRILEIKTTDAEPLTLPLTTDSGEMLPMAKLQTAASTMLPEDKEFSLRYTDSDGDQVTITSDADVKELEKYMQGEQLQRLELLVVPQDPPAAQRTSSVVQTQLRGLVAAMSKLTAKPETKPTPASAMNLLVASLQAVDVAVDADELATIKKETLLVLQNEELRKTVEELSASEEFKELADAMVTAIYEEDARAIEDAATAHFDELLVFSRRVVERCPALKPVVVTVAKSLVTGLVRYNDQEVDDNSSSCSSSSSCYSDNQDTVDVEVFAEEVVLHAGVVCTGCEKAPLVGVRYKSLEVPNFDLCEECEASGKYMHFEPFIKITDPSRAPKQKRTSEVVNSYVACDGCEMTPIVGIRFKSEAKEDFNLCEACLASGKWTESHGPFTKIEEPSTMRALKFTCRRGGKFGRHGMFGHHGFHHGHHHGHPGKFGRHHGKFGRHHGSHGHQGKFDHHHGPPGFDFHGTHPDHHGAPDHGPPVHHHGNREVRQGFPVVGHGRPDFHGRRGYVSPPEFGDRRHHHHGPPGFGPPGCFGRFGPPPFEFTDPRGQPMCPRGFEPGHPPFPMDFERRGHHGFHGHHERHAHQERHTRFSDQDEEHQQGRYHRRRHGCHGRGHGRWGRDVPDEEAGFAHEIRVDGSSVNAASGDDMEIVDAVESQGVEVDGSKVKCVESEDKPSYEIALTQLVAMGFDDTKKNVSALESAEGNVGGAVNALLSGYVTNAKYIASS